MSGRGASAWIAAFGLGGTLWLGAAREVRAQAIPWSPYAASHLATLAADVLDGRAEQSAAASTGRLLALSDMRSTAMALRAQGVRGGAGVAADRLAAGAGAITTLRADGAWRGAAGLVLEAWTAFTQWRLQPAHAGRLSAGGRVLFGAPSGPAGAWCGLAAIDRAGSIGGASGPAAGFWWGMAGGPRCACEYRASTAAGSPDGLLAVDCPLGAGLQVHGAASTGPAALALGLRVERGPVRLDLERTVNGVLGDGIRLGCARVWR